MFAKLLNLLFLYLGEKLSPESQAQKSLASFGMEKVRSVIGVLTAVIFAMIFFSHSVGFLLDDLKGVYQTNGTWGFTELSLVPLVILLAVGITLYFSFRDKTWNLEPEPEKPAPTTDFQPLVTTVNVLLTDIIEDRRKDRQSQPSHATQATQTNGVSHDF